MTPKQYECAQALVEAALSHGGSIESQKQFVEGAFHDDPKVLEIALAFLESHHADFEIGQLTPTMLGELHLQADYPPPAVFRSFQNPRELPDSCTGSSSARGSSGQGKVWLCDQGEDHFKRPVAVKVFRRPHSPGRPSPEFVAEVGNLKRLEHVNIAKLIDWDYFEDARPWFAMEYVPDASSFLDYCESKPLAEKLKLFCELCDAVAAAHRELVVHRDIKNSNILISRDGRLKLIDFGISKLLNSDEAGLPAMMSKMTRATASPEQLRGQPATTQTDIWALGLILYELVL